MFETTIRDGVCRCRCPGTRWLSTAPDGGVTTADAAYNVSVPDGFDRRDLAAYGAERRARAGFEAAGPTLFTGVDLAHTRGSRLGSVTVVATAGLSNPAALPLDPSAGGPPEATSTDDPPAWRPGTVNLLVGTDRRLDGGGLATLLATAVEAKTATLLARTGFTGTTSDAVVVGCAPDGEQRRFAGSATAVGEAARACVREAILASLEARYVDASDVPDTVAEAEYGASTTVRAQVFDPSSSSPSADGP